MESDTPLFVFTTMDDREDTTMSQTQDIDLVNKVPDDVKSMMASTFVKSFNSMPAWLRWGTIIAVIVGVFYFTVAQKYITQYREDNQIEVMQRTVSELSDKVLILEEDHQDAITLYENIEEVRGILAAFETVERRRSTNLIKFIKKVHNNEYATAISDFEATDMDIHKEYQSKIEELFNAKLKKRMEERRKSFKDTKDDSN